MIADERQVRMAARLYEMRDTARRLLGEGYGAKMAELGAALKTVADKTQREPLSVAIEAARDAHGLTQCYILAAAVELAEPSSKRHNVELSGASADVATPSGAVRASAPTHG